MTLVFWIRTRAGMTVEAVPLPRSLPQGEGSQERCELFEPAGRVDGCRGMSLEPQLQGILSERDAPDQLPLHRDFPGYRPSPV